MCLFFSDFCWTWLLISDYVIMGSDLTHNMIFCLYSSRMANHKYHDILACANDLRKNL
jgi:hypothetical protein